MRFVILSQYYPPEVGAAQTRLHSFARTLLKLGHEVTVITALPNYPTGQVFRAYRSKAYVSEEIDGVPVRRSWILPVRHADFRRLLSYVTFQVASLPVVVQEIQRFRPDYLFVESPPTFLGLTGILVTRVFRIPFILNIADLWPDWAVQIGVLRSGGLFHKLGLFLEKKAYSEARFITVVVEEMRTILAEKGVPTSKVLFLPNGADPELFSPGDGPPRTASGKTVAERFAGRKLVLYAGTHGRYHGLDVALQAAEMLRGRSDIQFLFVGDGPEKDRLIQTSRTRGLTNVAFMDPVPLEHVADLLRLSTLALSVIQIPTRAAKILPAMSVGKPVVYAGFGEGARLVELARAGVVVPPRDPAALANAIVRIVDDPELARQLGQNGRRYIEGHLTWEALVSAWLKQLEERALVDT